MDFKAPYNRSDYIDFFRSHLLPEDFRDHSEDIAVGFKSNLITKVVKIGEVSSLELLICEVSHPSENDPRVSLSRDAFRLLAQYGAKRALIIFNSENSQNFRLSFATIDLKWEEGKRVQKEYSNPRRYSFFLGPETRTHTPEEYLIKQGRVKDFDDLKERFSIEVVNKEFYTQIAVLFTQLAGGKREIGRKSIDAGRGLLNLPSTVDDTLDKEFTVRLIGRLVFCWFLKKKRSDKNIPLLPEELLSAKAVSENKGYYHGILEPLFFEVLNTPVDNRTKKYQCSPWSQIPFLNGGLFTPHLHDYYESGPLGISKHINTLKVPDHWIKELFEVFETYNFTIDENTSVDVELSIEPEMLGRIFENLLAEINPETGETARKATGSYYTPRSIVEYMVDESLKQYLLTKTKLEEDKITRLLTYEDVEVKLTGSEKESVLNALDTIKIIDPACGSGAFPMGILQKMLLILQKIDPESEWWLDTKLSQIESKLLKKELGKKLKDENVNYVHKLGIIQSSIYGVDIQPIAVEISKLRFFLSLIVDETVNDAKENRGIEPLPNLEFKFVCANSLIGLPKKNSQQTLFEATDDIALLKDIRDEYLRSYGSAKKKVEKKFLEVQSKMAKHALSWALWGGEKSQTMKLSQWDPFSEEPCGWFDPEWMFGVKDGFDIVIANPPYVRVDDLSEEKRQQFKNIYKSAVGKYDLYYLFFEKAFSICKKQGCCVFISPNKFCAADSAGVLRSLIFQFINSGEILSTSRLKVFEDAANYPIISILCGSGTSDKLSFREANSIENLRISSKQYSADLGLFKILPQNVIPINITQNCLDLVVKLCKDSPTLSSGLSISEGLRIPKQFESDIKQEFEIVKQYQFEKYTKITKGSFISKKNLVSVTSERSERYLKMMEDKILIAEDALEINATIDKNQMIPQGGVYFATLKTRTIDLKVFLALLNSRLLSFLYEAIFSGMHMGGGYLRFRSKFLESLPLPANFSTMSREYQNRLKGAIDNIYKDGYSEGNSYERKINQMICELYGLTKKEIEIVESGLSQNS